MFNASTQDNQFNQTQNELLTQAVNYLINECGYEEGVDFTLVFTDNNFEIVFKNYPAMDFRISTKSYDILIKIEGWSYLIENFDI